MSKEIVLTGHELTEDVMEWIAVHRPYDGDSGDTIQIKRINKRTGNTTVVIERSED